MDVTEFFTNKEKTADGKVDVETPAFSATKVQSLIGGLVMAVIAVVPTKLKEDEQIVIAAIAAGTAILLGIFALWAVDIRTRQRAREATLRWGGGPDGGNGGGAGHVEIALPSENLVLQKGHNADEYEVKLAVVDKGAVSLVAARDGEVFATTFKEAPQQ
jgi:hypothetical protein